MTRSLTLTVALMTLVSSVPAYAEAWDDCIQQSKPDLAIQGCSTIVNFGADTKEKLAIAYGNRGNAYFMKLDYGLAVADFAKAIQLNPGFTAAYYTRGFIYSLAGDYDRAIVDFDMVTQLQPEHALAHTSRGIAYSATRDYDRAIADFDKAIELNWDAYYGRGVAYAGKGNYDRAIADFDKDSAFTGL